MIVPDGTGEGAEGVLEVKSCAVCVEGKDDIPCDAHSLLPARGAHTFPNCQYAPVDLSERTLDQVRLI